MPERKRGLDSCPICGRPADPEMRPFCSRRCANVDLGRWLTGHYRVPSAPVEGDEEASDPAPEQT
jgi:uncharacterized protein